MNSSTHIQVTTKNGNTVILPKQHIGTSVGEDNVVYVFDLGGEGTVWEVRESLEYFRVNLLEEE